ncbi:Predicted phosphohydrolase or phosphomutase, AlkP superfamily [Humidesulfovibrio mexicanus]|uniref:Predicted phosphohydrolase or phosphomutase, AlkP superfamily n=1 Tax=Humidesulfovibrio mexicanus TaxID=147047 RepID=A0A238Y217_9BACT|nr:alkaline phosphatase family protein [Humidesulfovibrio mexicanus]SNR64664.1 Predicted phosphohydrolase or phosphomutase, AlkP superfamily [Humidesulfovibrio mexicanus]
MSSSARPRLVVLGLDGLPLALARALGPELPNLARLLPHARAIESELPELSPVNWTSFFTAEGPGVHGVHGFTVLDPQAYTLRIANFADVRTPTIFERLGRAGLVSRVLNLPNMAPATPLKGMLVAGFVAESLRQAVFPPFLLGPLTAAGYVVEGDTTRGAFDPEHLLGQLRLSLSGRRAALDLLWPDLAWDLFVCVLTETDRLFHFLFPAVEDAAHPLHGDCLAFLRQWDQAIGEVLDRFDALPEPKRLVSFADHGFCRLEAEADLNRVLFEAGFLKYARPPRDEWDAGVIGEETLAFAMDPGRIVLHRRGRFARGRVGDADAPALLADLRAVLRGLSWRGRTVMEQVLDGPELYGTTHAPDLVCVPQPGVDLKARFDRAEIFGHFGRQGMHSPQDVFFADTRDDGRPARLRDTGRLVLEHFGLCDTQDKRSTIIL